VTPEAQAEHAARASYGRLLAILAAPSRDIPAAEDALCDAFERALRSWPVDGVPQNPDGWLLTVARNRLRDTARSSASRLAAPLLDVHTVVDDVDPDAIPDRRLALLFVCAHPAVDPAVRTPLMLQTVLGLDAAAIARAFVLPEPTLAQRLVRAKRRIRDAGIGFVVPDRSAMPARLPAVLEAVYGAYSIDWQVVSGETLRESLAHEALYLASTLAELLPDEPEALGLASLLGHSLARAGARVSLDGCLVPLDEQDPALWNRALIARSEHLLLRAHRLGRIGRFQLEAAIQSAHAARMHGGAVDWAALRDVHETLVRIAPTLGARVALAATIARVEGPRAGLAVLDRLDGRGAVRFQPSWATRAHLLAEAGDTDDAIGAYARAISLTTDAPSRELLRRRVAALTRPGR
jgi:predicted RNA polymerase sigma factor